MLCLAGILITYENITLALLSLYMLAVNIQY
jgi:hypothetical protein